MGACAGCDGEVRHALETNGTPPTAERGGFVLCVETKIALRDMPPRRAMNPIATAERDGHAKSYRQGSADTQIRGSAKAHRAFAARALASVPKQLELGFESAVENNAFHSGLNPSLQTERARVVGKEKGLRQSAIAHPFARRGEVSFVLLIAYYSIHARSSANSAVLFNRAAR